ncbi:MAG TPA: hemerythrin domain-containing protein [Pyrinomonadaceae bacterium]|nr:hemerythrin domain-containing protein [Pyrinomonadaceae bacterium]
MPIQIGQPPESDFRNPLGLLSDCHRRIERFLNALLKIAEEANGETMAREQSSAFEVALRYFREAAPLHTLDEEDSLFPRLRDKHKEDSNAALAVLGGLHDDHKSADAIHRSVDELGREWLMDGELAPEKTQLLMGLLRQLSETYRRHIAIEDSELFPLAAKMLNATELSAIAAEMASRRGLLVPGR